MAGKVVTAYFSDDDIPSEGFDHPAWSQAEPITIKQRWSGEEAPSTQHAEARIVWSPNALEVRFICKQPVPPLINPLANARTKTIGLWNTDVCEIFLAPDASAPNSYFEFEAAPNGAWLDLRIRLLPEGRETDWNFQSGMTAAARLLDDQLTIRISVPWSVAIPKPSEGDDWRVNLFRCVGTGNERYLAWRPTYTEEPDFHVPEFFGWLRFG